MNYIGHIPDLTNEQYHEADGVSSSGIIEYISKSPKHYIYFQENEKEKSKSMKHGTAIHGAVLEKDKFDSFYVKKPEGLSFATKIGKAWREENKHKEMLTHKEYIACTTIRDNIYKDKLTKIIFSNGVPEQSFFVNHKSTGLKIKCRTDWFIEKPTEEQLDAIRCVSPELTYIINEDTSFIVDIKSMEDITLQGFRNALNYRHMDIPSQFYPLVMCEFLQKEDVIFLYLVVESVQPHCPVVRFAGVETNKRAANKIEAALWGIKSCIENNDWPGPKHGEIVEAYYFQQKEIL